MPEKKETTRQTIARFKKEIAKLDKLSPLAKNTPEYRSLQAELQRLKDVLETNSKRGKKSRNKGANYERKVAGIFKDALGVLLSRTPQSGGFQKGKNVHSDFKGDIVCLEEGKDFNLHIECKNAQTLSIPAWTKQAEEDCPPGKIPAIVFHRKNTDVESIVLKLEDFLNIVDKDKIIIVKEQDSHAKNQSGDVQPVQGGTRKRRVLPRKKNRPL